MKQIGPTYYVMHPDGSYSMADPQPIMKWYLTAGIVIPADGEEVLGWYSDGEYEICTYNCALRQFTRTSHSFDWPGCDPEYWARITPPDAVTGFSDGVSASRRKVIAIIPEEKSK